MIHLRTTTRILLAAALALTVGIAALAQTGGGYDLSWFSVDGGGGMSSGGAYTLSGVAGQPDAGVLSAAAYTLSGGFLPGLSMATHTPTSTHTPTHTSTHTPTSTRTPTATGTTTHTPGLTPSATPSPTPSGTSTATATATRTATVTPTGLTPSATPSRTSTATATNTRTATVTPTGPSQRARCFLPMALKSATLLYQDEFSGPALGACWEWVREDPTHWSLSARPGFLRIITQKGGVFGTLTNNARNLLLQPAPEGDFVIETRVLFRPTQNFQTAGLVVYQDDDNLMALARAFCDVGPPACLGNAIYHDLEEGGANAGHYVNASASEGEAYLRLVRRGDLYESYHSVDGVEWTLLGTQRPSSAFRPRKVGLAVDDSDQGATEIPADFDYFRCGMP